MEGGLIIVKVIVCIAWVHQTEDYQARMVLLSTCECTCERGVGWWQCASERSSNSTHNIASVVKLF